jgi:hypothetical protein
MFYYHTQKQFVEKQSDLKPTNQFNQNSHGVTNRQINSRQGGWDEVSQIVSAIDIK